MWQPPGNTLLHACPKLTVDCWIRGVKRLTRLESDHGGTGAHAGAEWQQERVVVVAHLCTAWQNLINGITWHGT